MTSSDGRERVPETPAQRRHGGTTAAFRDLAGLAIELISTTSDLDQLFERLLLTARDLIGAHQGIVNLRPDSDWTEHVRTVSLSDTYAAWRDWDASASGDGIYAWASEQNRAFRMSQSELEAHPRWRGFGEHADAHPPMRGWLVAPLTAPDGHNIGLVQLSDPITGEFTDHDVDLLELLAAIASAAVEHRRLLNEATSARSHLAAVYDALPGGVVVRAADGRVTYSNQWAEEHLGVGHHEIIGSAPGEAYQLLDRSGTPLPPDRYPSSRAARGEQFDADIVGFDDRTGRRRWLATSGRPVEDPDADAPGGLIVFVDATESIEGEERLARSERLLREAEHLAGVGSFFRDIRSGSVTVSDELARMFSVETGSHERDDVIRWIDLEDRTRVFDGAYATFVDGTPFSAVVRTTGGEGVPEFVELQVERAAADDGTPIGLLGTIRDLTDHRRQEERLAAAMRMELTGQLAGGLAHDFNNLLTVLVGHVELLREGAAPHEIEHLDVIASVADRAARLTRQLLELGRQELLTPRAVDLNELTTRLAEMARSVVPSTITVDVRLHPAPVVAEVDPSKFDQVLLNLVLNARDAIGLEHGTITVSTEQDDATDERRVRVSVADDGPGMEPEVLARVREPFFTTKGPGVGTGLGLPSSIGLVAQSGGDLRIESRPGTGTVVIVELPRSAAAPIPLHEPLPAPVPRAAPARILLAEDDRELRRLLHRVLTERGYDTYTAADGDEALDVASRSREPFDVLLTDITMPGRTGHELAELLRGLHPTIDVIYMSGYTADEAVRTAIATGSVEFVAKPFRVDDLLDVVRRVLEARPST